MTQPPPQTQTSAAPPSLLFTAFEPSGDDHAAPVIAELRRRYPGLPIYAWGGPRMERAGAIVIERTGDDAVMGLPGLAKIREHQRINARIDSWLHKHNVIAHIPVDSPAANFPICSITRAHGAKVIHLVAPQIWAWGRWRIHKLRRLTDHVLCLLPFEEEFFRKRGVPATFIGHMLFDRPLRLEDIDRRTGKLGGGSPRIAMMPGSRPDELRRHLPVLLGAFRRLRAAHPEARAVFAVTSDRVAADVKQAIESAFGSQHEDIKIVVQDTDAVVRWCDIALVKSGTVTLHVAKQLRPMVIFYRKPNPLFLIIAGIVKSTTMFSLPNLVARRRIVPELIPYFGGPGWLTRQAEKLLSSADAAATQRADLASVVAQFEGRNAAASAADVIERVAALQTLEKPMPTAAAVQV